MKTTNALLPLRYTIPTLDSNRGKPLQQEQANKLLLPYALGDILARLSTSGLSTITKQQYDQPVNLPDVFN
jgi:hypothetical protein